MKFNLLVVSSIAGLVAAAPTAVVKRQSFTTSNQLSGPCRPITLVFARGTGEPGNIGDIIGPELEAGLASHYGASNLATQGVNYAASLTGNFDAGGCDPNGIATMEADLKQAASQCPNTKIVAGGYSQGAACLHGAFRALDAGTLNRIVGAVTFGDTRKAQDGGQIPNYPPSKTMIYCAPGDLVCDGTLLVSPAHLSYGIYAGPATIFLAGLIGNI
ncbi:hypothetical protein ANO11243_074960 [Dothideomycetidae sp. 11243]|nr:hypothetical protein ANO11243_074960 [fungal sp. No.11243]